jgi:hypothetical protein
VAKIKHTRNENGQNFTHQYETTLFWRKKDKINLHQNFPIYGVVELYHNILFHGRSAMKANEANDSLLKRQV